MKSGNPSVVTVSLSGVHVVRVKLASGKRVEYHYAWRGGPRLSGMPGSAEYTASFSDAHMTRKQPKSGTLKEVIVTYKASGQFDKLAEPTKRAYRGYLDRIEEEFGTTPFKVVEDARWRGDAIDWRDTMRENARTADYALGTLKRLLDHARERGLISVNVLEGVRHLHRADRSDNIWTADDVNAFNKHSSKELQWAVALAIHTGLRQKDLVSLPWGAYDKTCFIDRTSKTKRNVIIPATMACRALMERIEKRHLIILTTQRGKRPWTQDGLRASFSTACKFAKVTRNFHDLRRTAATNLLCAGVEASQVAMIMGWSEEEIEALKRKYVSRAAVVAAVVAQLEKGG